MLANFDSLAALGFRIPFGDFLFYPDTKIRDTHRQQWCGQEEEEKKFVTQRFIIISKSGIVREVNFAAMIHGRAIAHFQYTK